MKLSKVSVLSLAALTAILIAGLSVIGAEEATDATVVPESEKVQPTEEPAPEAEEELPLPDVFTPPSVEAGCQSQSCGNTGTLYGYGNNCTAAKDDLDDAMTDEAYEICPGVVTGITRNYGSCSGGAPIAECKYSGNADISCKICPGQSCGPEW